MNQHALLSPLPVATDCVEKIYHVICRHQDSIQAPGLWTGHLGTALFYSLYAQHSGCPECVSHAENRFDKALHLITRNPESTHSGFTELSLVAHYLSSAGIITIDLEKRFSDLDKLLLKKMRQALQSGYVGGFSCGALGYGLHFLNRALLYPDGYRQTITEIIQGLKANAVYGPGACHWCYNQYYTSTLWNGQGAVILFLTRAAELGLLEKDSISDMLVKAVNHLLHQHKHQIASELLSMQIGDLGTGYALLRAGQTFENDSWQLAGLQILGARAGKTLTAAGADLPLGILNGAAGAAVVFEKVHQLTANPLFSQAAKRCYTSLLSAKIPQENEPAPPLSRFELTFGTGICGIGASMIQMLHPQKISLQPLLWLI